MTLCFHTLNLGLVIESLLLLSIRVGHAFMNGQAGQSTTGLLNGG